MTITSSHTKSQARSARSQTRAQTTETRKSGCPGAPTRRGTGTGPQWPKFVSEFLGRVRIRIRIRNRVAATAVHSGTQFFCGKQQEIPGTLASIPLLGVPETPAGVPRIFLSFMYLFLA